MTPLAAVNLTALIGRPVSAMPALPRLDQSVIPLMVVCGLLSGGFVAAGRLGTRLHRADGDGHPGLHDRHCDSTRQRALRWSRISCYGAASLLLLIALVLAADTYFLQP